MQFLALKNLTASILVGTALSASAMTAEPAQIVSLGSHPVEIRAEANIDVPVTTRPIVSVKAQSQARVTPDVLDVWIDKLVQKESNGRRNVKIVDVNGLHSYGCLQFQKPTFLMYGRRFGLVSGDEPNFESLIMNCELQKVLTKKMIQENPLNWRHWYTSVVVKDLGFPPVY